MHWQGAAKLNDASVANVWDVRKNESQVCQVLWQTLCQCSEALLSILKTTTAEVEVQRAQRFWEIVADCGDTSSTDVGTVPEAEAQLYKNRQTLRNLFSQVVEAIVADAITAAEVQF
jgi:hypothetical protein